MAPTPLGTKRFAMFSMQLKLLTSNFHRARRNNGKKNTQNKGVSSKKQRHISKPIGIVKQKYSN
jgi:hypothetical protein